MAGLHLCVHAYVSVHGSDVRAWVVALVFTEFSVDVRQEE